MIAKLEDILEQYKNGILTAEEAGKLINTRYYCDIGHTVIDTAREERTGYPEAIMCQGKSAERIAEILTAMDEKGIDSIATRLEYSVYCQVSEYFKKGDYYREARILTVLNEKNEKPKKKGIIAVVCAGTSDIPVAEEAAVTAEFYGHKVERFYDSGVAGIHRLFRIIDEIRKSDAIIVAAGMEGALPGVVAGLVSSPVIAVPVSTGYGISLNGITALFSMLTGCATGVSVVNIDNGFGAAQFASRICRAVERKK